MSMKAIINKNVQRLIAVADTETQARPFLGCVKVENSKAVATNGFLLAETAVKIEGDGTMLVPAKLISLLKGFTRSHKRGETKDMIATTDEAGIITGTVENSGALSYSQQMTPGTYPKYESLFPTTPVKGFIALNIGLLRKICSLSGNDAEALMFKIRGETEPVEFVLGLDIHGLIMPMCVQHDSVLWTKEEAVKEKAVTDAR